MTTMIRPSADVDVVLQDDVEAVVQHTLAGLGLTFTQLADQARTRHFESIEARLAWLAIGDLYQG